MMASEKIDSAVAPPNYEEVVTSTQPPPQRPLESPTRSFDAETDSSSHVTTVSDDIEIQGESEFARAVRLFDNPLAHDKQWSVQADDFQLVRLRKVDFLVEFKSGSGKGSSKSKLYGFPSFNRDPVKNPKFNPNQSFDVLIVPSRGNTRGFRTGGFKRYYEGNIMATHDISPADWYQFLRDMVAAEKICFGSGQTQGVPMAALTKLSELLVNRVFNSRDTQSAVQRVLDLWNKKFFNVRGVDVYFESNRFLFTGGDVGILGSNAISDKGEIRSRRLRARNDKLRHKCKDFQEETNIVIVPFERRD